MVSVKKLGKSGGGFTLIEIMIVMAVIGILAMVTVPKYQVVREQYRLEASAQTTAQQLRYAKQLAMDQRQTIYVVFNANTVGLLDENYAPIGEPQKLDIGVVFDQTNNPWLTEVRDATTSYGWGMSYNYQGFAQGNGGILLNSSHSGRSVSINIAPGTGYIAISWP